MAGVGGRTSASLKVADYFIARSRELTGQPLCNLKLQKLVYYAQGFALVLRGHELFSEALEAWDNGPVVRNVYHEFRSGSMPIAPSPEFNPEDYLPETREFLDAILETYGRLRPTRLSGMTHSEPPWSEAYKIGRNTQLSVKTMKSFFSDLVESSRKGESINGRPIFPVDSFRHQRRRELSSRMERHREKLKAIASRERTGNDPWADDAED